MTIGNHCVNCGLPKNGFRDKFLTCNKDCSDKLLHNLAESIGNEDIIRLLRADQIASPRVDPFKFPLEGEHRAYVLNRFKNLTRGVGYVWRYTWKCHAKCSVCTKSRVGFRVRLGRVTEKDKLYIKNKSITLCRSCSREATTKI